MPEQLIRALRDSEACFRNMIEKNADAMMVIQQNGVISFANPAAEILVGRASGTLIGELFGIPLAHEETTEIEIPAAHQDPKVAEMRVVEAVWEGERAYLASLRDITDRKHANDALRFVAEASRQLAGTLDYPKTISSVAALAVAHLADWCVIDLYAEEESCERRVAVAHADTSREALVEIAKKAFASSSRSSVVEKVLASGEPQVFSRVTESSLRSIAGSSEAVEVFKQLGCKSAMVVPLQARGRTLGAMTFVLAFTSMRYRSADLALANDLAHRAAMALDNARLYDDAQIAVRRRDEFLAMLAHELRNPLAAIQSAVDVMRGDKEITPLLGKARAVIERQGRQMAHLLDDLLDIARVMRGKIELRLEEVDLARVIKNAVQTIQPLIDQSGHDCTVTILTGKATVSADPMRLEQVLVNLLSNAAKYTPRGGTIRVEAICIGDRVEVSVSDNGDGIAPDNLRSVFDLFVQGSRSLARSEGGLGIGLTLVRELVEMHGGHVQAFSEGRNKGSRFVVSLPRVGGAPAGTVATVCCTERKSRRVVIVEDNADTRFMLQCLFSLDGHQVEVAEDGLTGVETILRFQPDVAFVDIGLPKLDGFQVAQRVRASEGGDKIRLVAVTGYNDPQRAIEAGFDCHFVKPVKHDVLSVVVDNLV